MEKPSRRIYYAGTGNLSKLFFHFAAFATATQFEKEREFERKRGDECYHEVFESVPNRSKGIKLTLRHPTRIMAAKPSIFQVFWGVDDYGNGGNELGRVVLEPRRRLFRRCDILYVEGYSQSDSGDERVLRGEAYLAAERIQRLGTGAERITSESLEEALHSIPEILDEPDNSSVSLSVKINQVA